MSVASETPSLSFRQPGVDVERAIAEIRAGRVIVIRHGTERLLATAAELAGPEITRAMDKVTRNSARLILPTARLKRLGAKRHVPGTVSLPDLDLERIERLALKVDAKIDAPVTNATEIDVAALELTALAYIHPPVIGVTLDPVEADPAGVISVEATDILGYRALQARTLSIVGRAPVPLEEAPETEFVVFRGGEGLRDQVAIIVGKLGGDEAVPVRLHSACLTGDLFGSLKCDCGDQLRETVRWMADNGGGILLYLDQEGRGNGLSNKMRAYRLQADGWDTYDADEVLGFDQDQRRFDFAAEMLRQLGVHKVVALTNNPVKIGALRQAGLDVVGTKRVLGRPTKHNVRYLASKRDNAGHFIDMDALLARAAQKD